MRPGTTLEVLLSLKPYFKKDGLVTAGNASGIVDGAAATVIASADYAKTHGLKPLGRLVSWAVVGGRAQVLGDRPGPRGRKGAAEGRDEPQENGSVGMKEGFGPEVSRGREGHRR